MEISKFEDIEKVFDQLIEKNKKYVIIKHELKPNEEIKEHSHENANEFVVIKDGAFEVKCNDEIRNFNLNNEVFVIYFPKGSKHSLKNLEERLNYFVIRDVIE